MSIAERVRRIADIPEHPLVRVVAYYVFLFSAVAIVTRLVPGALALLNAPMPVSAFLMPGTTGTGELVSGQALAPGRVVLAAVVSLASACLLMLPVTWIYVQTRRKKGFQQSIVQTLVILPLVFAGVILLVQDSTALAFSLGGIVGAVSFRNTLRDTKDTIYIFLAIVVGLAAGVHAMLVAATISVAFNIVAVLMWWTDFGRAGATLEGAPAERRLRRAKALANRTAGFISMVDRELLQSMTPEQLEVLAARARVRHDKAVAEASDVEVPVDDDEKPAKERRNRLLRVEVAGTAAAGRRAADAALDRLVKKWEFAGGTPAGASGPQQLEYRVRLRKGADPEEFLTRFRGAAGPLVRSAALAE